MEEYVNPLWKDRDKKIKEFEQGVATKGVEYLKEINRKARLEVQEKNLKSKDYVAVRKEQLGEEDDGKKD